MEKVLGICYAYDVKDAYQDILDIGFTWTRMGVCFPWKDRMYGELDEKYIRNREEIRKAHEAGIQVMVTTPGMGGYFYDEEKKETYYHEHWPAFIGEKGTEEYYRNVEETCAFFCRDLGENAGYLWQCMNEIDIPTFSGNYPMEVTAMTARASARGIVRENPEAKCGINLSRYHEDGLKVADMVYGPGHSFGYIGDDQYFGSWQGKTVESWNDVIDALHERYRLPVLANEWGYSSGGKTNHTRPDPSVLPEGIPDVCYEKSWYHEVEGGHTRAVQAEYLRRGLEIFAKNPHIIGSFLFCYKDAKYCYHCGEPDCPSECYWGIMHVDGNPKEACAAVRQAIQDYYK